MAKRKNSREDEDILVEEAVVQETSTGDFIEDNQQYIIYALMAVALLVAAYFIYKYMFQAPKQQEAVEQMYKAQDQFDRDSFNLALTNPGAGYPGFLDIIDSYGGTKAANTANYYAGISYLNLGQFDNAVKYLKDFSASGEVLPITKNGALGDAYAEKGDLNNAMSYYKKAVSAGDNEILTTYYLKKVGLLSEKNGDKAAANAAYKRIRDDYPNSPEAGEIEKYIFRTQ